MRRPADFLPRRRASSWEGDGTRYARLMDGPFHARPPAPLARGPRSAARNLAGRLQFSDRNRRLDRPYPLPYSLPHRARLLQTVPGWFSARRVTPAELRTFSYPRGFRNLSPSLHHPNRDKTKVSWFPSVVPLAFHLICRAGERELCAIGLTDALRGVPRATLRSMAYATQRHGEEQFNSPRHGQSAA